MVSTLQTNNSDTLKDQAVLIASEIFNLINQYTNDSNVSKFFLSDEAGRACYSLAGGFSSIVYTPLINPEDIEDTAILSFFYTLMTYGFNIYLKEHSFITNSSPYTIPTDKKTIKKIQKKTLLITAKGKLASTPLADKIIYILIENVKIHMKIEKFTVKGHKLNEKKFLNYTKLSLYWGYNFAKELLIEEKIKR
jgi:hypothetical protein